ncbi:MAG: hypothetical protein QGG71_16490 [Pirellulaceae bacterium]|nr:hypothetical protein [Pirellulaceae bacterium]
MMSRFATFTMFFLLACLTSVVFGQTGYDRTLMALPPTAYPQTYPASGWNAGSPSGFFAGPKRLPQPYAMPNMSTPMATGYMPMVASPPRPSVGYYVPAVAPRATGSYWAEMNPMAGFATQAQAAETRGFFAPTSLSPTSLPAPNRTYVPVPYADGGPAPIGPHGQRVPGPARQREGSVVRQLAPTTVGQEPTVQHGDPIMLRDDAFYGAPANTFPYDVAVDAASGHGLGKTHFGCRARCCTSPWFVGFGGLLMSRDNENDYFFSYDSANEAIQLTNGRDANFDWAGGYEVSFGRTINCGCNAVEAVYWALFPCDGTTTTTDADTTGALNGILNWDQLNYGLDPFGAPWTADVFVNNSSMHMVRRENEIHNVEVNFLTYLGGGRGPSGTCGKGSCGHGDYCGSSCHGAVVSGSACGGCSACGGAAHARGNGHAGVHTGCGDACGSRWSHDWLVGVRFFRFYDNLLFGAEWTGGNYDFRYEGDEIYYNIDITNDLVGMQLGFSGAYAASCRCSLDYGLKFGLFGNHISHTSEIGGSQGIATINNGPNLGTAFFVDNQRTMSHSWVKPTWGSPGDSATAGGRKSVIEQLLSPVWRIQPTRSIMIFAAFKMSAAWIQTAAWFCTADTPGANIGSDRLRSCGDILQKPAILKCIPHIHF